MKNLFLIVLFLFVPCYGKAIAHWRFNEDANDPNVYDSVGGFTGTAQQDTCDVNVTGKVCGALSFNGTTDYVDTNNTFESVFQSSFSINLWAKPVVGENITSDIFGVYYGETYHFVSMTFDQDLDKIYFYYGQNNGTKLVLSTVSTITLTGWTMVTVTIEDTGSSVSGKIYYNDLYGNRKVDTSTAAVDMSAINLGSSELYIGLCELHNYHYKGSLDNVTLWDEVLTPVQIKRLYNNGNGTEMLGEVDELRRETRARYEN